MRPLLDGDIFLYEIASCAEYKDEEGEHIIRSFDFVEDLLEDRIGSICEAVNATEPPTLFFTGKGNFRFEIAKKKPYKGNRLEDNKPFHYENTRVYLEASYNYITAEDCEADDELAMAQAEDTVICTRDKDLRMVPGWHYGWECGKQPEFFLQKVSELGELIPKFKDEKFKDLKGTGLRWFYAQLLIGDSTDNIPGCPRVGPKKAYDFLKNCEDEKGLFSVVKDQYINQYEDNWEKELLEQAYLLWMVRERDEEGNLLMWKIPYD